MCMWDGESYTVYSRHTVKRARKAHTCDECFREIAPGESYEYAFGVYDGTGNTHAICAHCMVAVGWLLANCDGFMHGGVHEDISQHRQEYPGIAADLSKLEDGMSAKWRDSDGALMPLPAMPPKINVEKHA